MIIACLGDSITAGSPLWDPDPAVRAQIPEPDERSQCVNTQRTDQIAARFEVAVEGADALIVQGGINDIVQRQPVEEAARNLAGMTERALGLGLRVGIANTLPWNNGDARAAEDIARLNELVATIAAELGASLYPFNETLADPAQPYRMPAEWTDDGNHPSIEGHRLLGERGFFVP